MNNLTSLKFMTKETIVSILDSVNNNDSQQYNLHHKVAGLAFFQASTRTRLSFEIAANQLGLKVVGFSDGKTSRCFDDYFEESIEDFGHVIAELVDILIIRHTESRIPEYLSTILKIPVINAGDGENEHPVQALQDIWLMQKKVKSLEKKTIGFLGDISRNHRSLIFGLSHFKTEKLIFMLPPNKALPEDIKVFLESKNMHYTLCESLFDMLAEADFISSFTPSAEELKNKKLNNDLNVKVMRDFVIDMNIYSKSKSNAYILNAGPRTYEVSKDMDNHPKFLFLEQVKAGIFMKKAVLYSLLNAK